MHKQRDSNGPQDNIRTFVRLQGRSERTLTVSCIHGATLHEILRLLDYRSLCSASQVCQDWRTAGAALETDDVVAAAVIHTLCAAGDSDDLWHALASSRWPEHTLLLQPVYNSFKELYSKDNTLSACPTVDLAKLGKCSAYKYNRPSYYFQCNLITLQWDRGAKLIRLCFEARGDIDLRHPDDSHLAVVMTKPEHNYTSVGTVQPCPSELIQTSKPEACELWVCSERHIKVMATSRARQQQQVSRAQGCLVWTEDGLLQSPLSQLQSQHEGFWGCDTSLVFCYANAVVSGLYLDADCKTVELLKIPAQQHFADAFLSQCTSFELPYAPCEALRTESEEQAHARWRGLPQAVQQNPHWWG